MPQPQKDSTEPKRLHLRPLAPYEDRLLAALSYFRTQRKRTTQAHHCLSMYLRQSETRIMGEVGFYADSCGLSRRDFLELIYTDPDKVDQLISEAMKGGVSPVADLDPDRHDAVDTES